MREFLEESGWEFEIRADVEGTSFCYGWWSKDNKEYIDEMPYRYEKVIEEAFK